MEFFDIQTIAFLVLGAVFSGYAILDGFDLGVGALHLFTKKDHDRRVFLNAIGPVWDGNEVWLVTGGGVLFAAFPEVYATTLSAAYTYIMLLFVGLIFRAVALEFRSKEKHPLWRKSWDIGFSVASILLAILFGTLLGNIVLGIPIDATREFTGEWVDFLHPYALLVGITTLALFMNHGAIYLTMKTEGELLIRIKRWVRNTTISFIVLFVLLTIATLVFVPHMAEKMRTQPWLFVLPVLTTLAIANVPRELQHRKYFRAFLSSCLSIGFLLMLFALGLFPDVVRSTIDPAYSLDIYNSTSSEKTLQIILTIAAIGVPFVLAYSFAIYWIFRGKVKLGENSY